MPRKIQIAVNTAIDKSCSTTNKENNKITSDTTLEMIQKMYPNKINFSIAETAEIICVSYDFIREHVKDGTIKSVKYGDRIMIGISELSRLLNEGA